MAQVKTSIKITACSTQQHASACCNNSMPIWNVMKGLKLTTFEDMYETHEQCAQLLAVEGVLLLCNINFNLSGGNVIQQHSY